LLIGQLLAFSAPAALASMFAGFPLVVDRLIVGHFRPAPEVGIYQAASSASSFFPVILTAFSAILGPMIADMQHLGERERLLEVYRISTKWAVYVSLPIFLVVIVGAPEVMATLFGARYISGSLLLVVLATGQFINVSTGSINTVFVMTGHQNRWLVLSGMGLAADLVVGYSLTGRFGTVGAAFATAVSVGGVWVLAILEGRRLLNLWPYDRRFFKGLGAGGVALLGLALVRAGVNASAFVTLVIMSFTSVALFLVVLLALGIDPEDRHVLLYLWDRLSSSRKQQRDDRQG
jgi:O-antigen/teichoic acid export membrane protein